MADPHVITLRRPIGPKGKEITELTLREPTVGEVLKASRETGRGLALSLVTQVAGVDPAVIEALPTRVSNRALAYLLKFVDPILNETLDDAGEPLDEIVVTLEKTIQAGTTWVDSLTLREPTLGDMIKADKYDGMQRTIVLVALASSTPRPIIDLLPISVFAIAAAYVMSFTEAAPASGGESLAA